MQTKKKIEDMQLPFPYAWIKNYYSKERKVRVGKGNKREQLH